MHVDLRRGDGDGHLSRWCEAHDTTVAVDDLNDRELVEVHSWMHRIIIITDISCSTSE
jgi:hypothetical protein